MIDGKAIIGSRIEIRKKKRIEEEEKVLENLKREPK